MKYFTSLDLFKINVSLNFNDRNKYGTKLGATFTIILVSLILYYAISLMLESMNSKKVKNIFYFKNFNQDMSFNFSQVGIIMFVRNSSENLRDLVDLDLQINYSREGLEIAKCNETDLTSYDVDIRNVMKDKIKDVNNISKKTPYCINANKAILTDIQKIYDMNIRFSLKPGGENFEMGLLIVRNNVDLNIGDMKTRVETFPYLFKILRKNSNFNSNLSFSTVTIKIKEGYFFPHTFLTQFYQFNNPIYAEDLDNPPQDYLIISFIKLNLVESYEWDYYTFTDDLSKVGGILSVGKYLLKILVVIVQYFYRKIFYFEVISNSLEYFDKKSKIKNSEFSSISHSNMDINRINLPLCPIKESKPQTSNIRIIKYIFCKRPIKNYSVFLKKLHNYLNIDKLILKILEIKNSIHEIKSSDGGKVSLDPDNILGKRRSSANHSSINNLNSYKKYFEEFNK
jgi:hypothetical protein